MIISGINIKNKFVDLKDVSLDLSKNGLYMIHGENGAGKTLLLEQIVYGRHNVTFSSEEQRHAYDNKREELFAYVAQDNEVFPVTVWQYLSAYTGEINDKKARELLDGFGLKDVKMDEDVSGYSGGEFAKLSIIAGILKDTPYLFFDEPTNNLDDSSVEFFCQAIQELIHNHTVVIVSHDPRLTFETYNQILVKKGAVTTKFIEGELNQCQTRSIKKKLSEQIFELIFSRKSIGTYAGIIAMATVLLICYNLMLNSNYSTELLGEELFTPEIIVCYSQSTQIDNSTTKRYANAKNIEINQENIFDYLTYEELERLINDKIFDDVIISDDQYINNLQDVFGQIESGQPAILAIPNILYEEYGDCTGWAYAGLTPVTGRLPIDGKKEVALSMHVLKEVLKQEINQSEVLNQKVMIDGDEYTIVGILSSDVCFVSFDESKNYGYHKLNVDAYSEIVSRNMAVGDDERAAVPETIMFFAEEEEKCLDYLVEHYPGGIYSGSVYAEVWVHDYNKEVMKEILPKIVLIDIGFIISLCSTILMLLSTTLHKSRVLERFYLAKGKVKRLTYIGYSCIYLCIGFIIMLANRLLSIYHSVTNKMLLVFFVALWGTVAMATVIKEKKRC